MVRCYSENIVSYRGWHTTNRLRRLIGVAIVSWVLAVVVTECGLPCLDSPPPHGPHATSALTNSQFADVIDHPHAVDGSMSHPHLKLTAAALPRVTTLALALALVIGLTLALGWRGTGLGVSMRGPPRPTSVDLSGQAILARFCIARC